MGYPAGLWVLRSVFGKLFILPVPLSPLEPSPAAGTARAREPSPRRLIKPEERRESLLGFRLEARGRELAELGGRERGHRWGRGWGRDGSRREGSGRRG